MNRIVAALLEDERLEAAKKLEEALNAQKQEMTKKMEEVAEKMLKEGFNIEIIAKIMGLSREEIEKLAATLPPPNML